MSGYLLQGDDEGPLDTDLDLSTLEARLRAEIGTTPGIGAVAHR